MAVVVYVPSRLGEGFFTDLPVPGAGDDAKAITYDHGTGAFVYAAASATPGGSTTQVQYNNAGAFAGDAGMTYDATNDRLTVAGGLVAPSMRPASDSTTALQWQNAAGTAFVTGDSTNGRVGIAVSPPGAKLHVAGSNNTYAGLFQYNQDPTNWVLTFAAFTLTNADATTGNHALFTFTDSVGGGSSAGIGCNFTDRGNHYGDIYVYTNGPDSYNQRLYIKNNGYIAIAHTAPTALFDIAASTTARASSRQRAGTAPTDPEDGDMWNDGNAYGIMVNGTNAVNTDGGLSVWMQSSTTARNVGRVLWQYTDKTDASRASRGSVTAFYTTTEHKPVTWGANSGGPLLSFYDVITPIARQVLATGAGATVDQVITALQNLGLLKQS